MGGQHAHRASKMPSATLHFLKLEHHKRDSPRGGDTGNVFRRRGNGVEG